MRARRVEGLASRNSADILPGDYEITMDANGHRQFWFCCPGTCGITAPINLRPASPDRPSWEFDGNEEAPTLKPSINHVGCWHGWLTAGEFHL